MTTGPGQPGGPDRATGPARTGPKSILHVLIKFQKVLFLKRVKAQFMRVTIILKRRNRKKYHSFVNLKIAGPSPARPGGHPVLREEVCGKVQRAFDKMDVCETKFVEMVSKDTTEAESQSTDWSNDDVQY